MERLGQRSRHLRCPSVSAGFSYLCQAEGVGSSPRSQERGGSAFLSSASLGGMV